MKRLMLAAWFLCSALAYAQPGGAPAAAGADPNDAIAQLRQGLIDSFNKGEVDRLLTFLDTNVVVTWQNGEVCVGPEAVRAYYNKMMTGDQRIVRGIKCDPEISGRHVFGEWAVSWGNLRDQITLMDGTELPFNTLFTATIAQRGDRWLVTGFHASVNAFQNPVLSLAMRKAGLMSGVSGALVGLLFGVVIALAVSRKRAPTA